MSCAGMTVTKLARTAPTRRFASAMPAFRSPAMSLRIDEKAHVAVISAVKNR